MHQLTLFLVLSSFITSLYIVVHLQVVDLNYSSGAFLDLYYTVFSFVASQAGLRGGSLRPGVQALLEGYGLVAALDGTARHHGYIEAASHPFRGFNFLC